ncbi:MAG: hypothetical protein AB1589_32745 [Cyanobacteriota bacterium]
MPQKHVKLIPRTSVGGFHVLGQWSLVISGLRTKDSRTNDKAADGYPSHPLKEWASRRFLVKLP